MGYLLREAFRTLCGMNQWSYAIFWKIASQNPSLLIWEDSFYEPLGLPFPPQNSGRNNEEMLYGRAEGLSVIPELYSSQSEAHSGDKIELAIKEMMANKQICIVGEGMIGRAALSGNYQWVLSSSFSTHAHPPEVSHELQHLFSAGIQTVAVVPVPHYGVVQLGSSLFIMENLGFLNDVKSLILQLGCIPGALLSRDSVERSRAHDTTVDNELEYPNSFIFESSKRCENDSYSSIASPFQSPHQHCILGKPTGHRSQPRTANPSKAGFHLRHQEDNNVVRAEVTPSNSIGANSVRNPQAVPTYWDDQNCIFNSFLGNVDGSVCKPRVSDPTHLNPQMPSLSDTCVPSLSSLTQSGFQDTSNVDGSVCKPNRVSDPTHLNPQMPSLLDTSVPSLSSLIQSGFQEGNMTELEGIPLFSHLNGYATQVLSGGSSSKIIPCQRDTLRNMTHPDDCTSSVLHTPSPRPFHVPKKHKSGNSLMSSNDVSLQQFMGNGENDLFDVFGVDMKGKLFGGKLCNSRTDLARAERSSVGELSESGVFSVTGTDNLLDAVVTGALSAWKHSSDDSLSCKTTLTKISSCSVKSDQVQGDITGFPRTQTKDATLGDCSFVGSIFGKSADVTCTKSSSICSWVEQGNPENSVLTGHSKRPDEPMKQGRKKTKPGENPRPRPKDRQLIQDRLKELRDIVPSGAKCSIDALLERTIKHMEFLQGVTKHGDKFKHINESRISNGKRSSLSKDKIDGGTTYAVEIGSDSMFCPVIVEDLNPPRQFHVEMLCEEQGFFLEIADMIRGLGLTILKGVLESRHNKTRARFAVEANRDLTRMDIFLSLVHLFEETVKGNSSPGNPFDDTTYMQQQ